MQRWDVLSEHNFRPNAHMVARQDGLITWAPDVPEQLKSMTLQYFRLAFSLICSKRSRLLSRLRFLHGRERNEDSLQRKIGDGLFETIGRSIWKEKESGDDGQSGVEDACGEYGDPGDGGSDHNGHDDHDHDEEDGSEYEFCGPSDTFAGYA